MIRADLNRSLIQRARNIGQRRIENAQAELAEVLQNAVPDGAVVTDENIVRVSARRLFDRMMTNEKLRSPHSFLGLFSGGNNPKDGDL